MGNEGRTEFVLEFPKTGRRITCRYHRAYLGDEQPCVLVTVHYPFEAMTEDEEKPSVSYIQMWAKHFAPPVLEGLPIVVAIGEMRLP